MVINGIILINKEKGISSNKVANKVKYLLHADKAGHLGTLDVLGEGLLPITLGKATKLFDYFLNKDKEYITVFKFGLTTTTLDSEGEITHIDDHLELKKEDIEKIIPKFIGKFDQIPPIYSAKKISGKKAYDLARTNQITENDLKSKEIEVYSIKLLECLEKNSFKFQIRCSSGTYIRSLCRDIAKALNTYGVMQSIIRTKCGDFSLTDSYTIKDVENGNYKIISVQTIFAYPELQLQENGLKLLNGQNVTIMAKDGIYKGFMEGQFLGLIAIKDNLAKFKLRLV